jgi:hypothetical protein
MGAQRAHGSAQYSGSVDKRWQTAASRSCLAISHKLQASFRRSSQTKGGGRETRNLFLSLSLKGSAEVEHARISANMSYRPRISIFGQGMGELGNFFSLLFPRAHPSHVLLHMCVTLPSWSANTYAPQGSTYMHACRHTYIYTCMYIGARDLPYTYTDTMHALNMCIHGGRTGRQKQTDTTRAHTSWSESSACIRCMRSSSSASLSASICS